jgi:hypothetical protein
MNLPCTKKSDTSASRNFNHNAGRVMVFSAIGGFFMGKECNPHQDLREKPD